ncbi:MAG: integrase core domain-containing protein, partial [Methylohalobius sp.]
GLDPSRSEARDLILARAPDKMRYAPARLDSQGRLRPVRRPCKPRKPKGAPTAALSCLATDTIERIRDGIRRYLVTFIDPTSRFAFAFAIPSKSARHTQAALSATLSLLPSPPQIVLSDNGSEFEAGFAQTLQQHGIARWYTYPKSPKMNAHIERFNRTLKESFVDFHEDLLFTDLTLFNQKLADRLVFYNTQRPHHALGQLSPLQFLLIQQPKCQRYWTHTQN